MLPRPLAGWLEHGLIVARRPDVRLLTILDLVFFWCSRVRLRRGIPIMEAGFGPPRILESTRGCESTSAARMRTAVTRSAEGI